MYFIFHLLLFNFQGPSGKLFFQEAHRRFTRDLDIIPYLRAFVKGFFKSFFNFFRATRCLSKFRLILSVDLMRFLFKEALLSSTMSNSLALRFTRPLYYIISFRVCQEVLQKFFKFFSKPFQKLSLPFLTRLLYYIIS